MSLAAILIAGILCFLFFFILGRMVSRRPLGWADARAVYFRGQGTALAKVFTKSGRSRPLIAGYVIAVALFAIARHPVWVPLLMGISQIMSQGAVESFKLYFRRTRPDYWLVGLDAGHSYPSGHATTAVVTFAAWALVISTFWLQPTQKYVIVALLLLWAAGIVWSRLALGAHYLTDVLGGLLFGGAWLSALCLFALTSRLVR